MSPNALTTIVGSISPKGTRNRSVAEPQSHIPTPRITSHHGVLATSQCLHGLTHRLVGSMPQVVCWYRGCSATMETKQKITISCWSSEARQSAETRRAMECELSAKKGEERQVVSVELSDNTSGTLAGFTCLPQPPTKIYWIATTRHITSYSCGKERQNKLVWCMRENCTVEDTRCWSYNLLRMWSFRPIVCMHPARHQESVAGVHEGEGHPIKLS